MISGSTKTGDHGHNTEGKEHRGKFCFGSSLSIWLPAIPFNKIQTKRPILWASWLFRVPYCFHDHQAFFCGGFTLCGLGWLERWRGAEPRRFAEPWELADVLMELCIPQHRTDKDYRQLRSQMGATRASHRPPPQEEVTAAPFQHHKQPEMTANGKERGKRPGQPTLPCSHARSPDVHPERSLTTLSWSSQKNGTSTPVCPAIGPLPHVQWLLTRWNHSDTKLTLSTSGAAETMKYKVK